MFLVFEARGAGNKPALLLDPASRKDITSSSSPANCTHHMGMGGKLFVPVSIAHPIQETPVAKHISYIIVSHRRAPRDRYMVLWDRSKAVTHWLLCLHRQ